MPEWLEGMIGPTMLLWLYALAFGVVWIVADWRGAFSTGADLISRWAMSLVIATWVVRDAHKRGRQLCYDYGMFLFFGWPVVAPVYLFQTRGVRAFLTLLWFIGIWFLVALSIGVVVAVREFSSS
jgi:hypothetical protein